MSPATVEKSQFENRCHWFRCLDISVRENTLQNVIEDFTTGLFAIQVILLIGGLAATALVLITG